MDSRTEGGESGEESCKCSEQGSDKQICDVSLDENNADKGEEFGGDAVTKTKELAKSVKTKITQLVKKSGSDSVPNKGNNSFKELKVDLGSPGEGNAWHHIVEQSQIGKSGFSSNEVNNINNIISIPHGKGTVHAKISGYYLVIRQNRVDFGRDKFTGYCYAPFIDDLTDDRQQITIRDRRYTAPTLTSTCSVVCQPYKVIISEGK